MTGFMYARNLFIHAIVTKNLEKLVTKMESLTFWYHKIKALFGL